VVEYRELAPSPALRPYVECYWTVHAVRDCPAYPVLPDGCADLLFTGARELQLVGSMTAAQNVALAKGAETLGVRFRPAMAALFVRAPWEKVTDRIVDAEGTRALADQLQQPIGRIAAIENWLHMERDPGPVQKMTDWFSKSPIRIDELSRQAGLSPRQLRRVFLAETGLTPKYLCRVLRFRRAVQQMSSLLPQPDFAALALDMGYYDQAHFINEFRQFSGHTPAAWQIHRGRFFQSNSGESAYAEAYEDYVPSVRG
jgi:AraC-like DNA-binding protein